MVNFNAFFVKSLDIFAHILPHKIKKYNFTSWQCQDEQFLCAIKFFWISVFLFPISRIFFFILTHCQVVKLQDALFAVQTALINCVDIMKSLLVGQQKCCSGSVAGVDLTTYPGQVSTASHCPWIYGSGQLECLGSSQVLAGRCGSLGTPVCPPDTGADTIHGIRCCDLAILNPWRIDLSFPY